MLLVDVNPLLYALRADVPDHAAWREWLEALLAGDEAFGLSNATLAAVVRIATSPRVFKTPTPLADVFEFIDVVRGLTGECPAHAFGAQAVVAAGTSAGPGA